MANYHNCSRSLFPRMAKGYTLIELLVVIFIISIVTGVALLSMHHNENKQLESFANELTQTLTLAGEQAMLQPVVLGLSISQDTFHFSSLHLGENNKMRWMPLDDTLLGKHRIPDDIQVVLKLENHHTVGDVADVLKANPQIIISTNGDITPFTLYVGRKGEKPRYVIQGDINGNVSNKSLS